MNTLDPLHVFSSTHHGVLHRRDLTALGVTEGQVRRLLRLGALRRAHPNTFLLAGVPPSFEQRALAAQQAAGEFAVCSHRTAGALLGLRGMSRGVIDVTIGWYRPRLDGVRLHRTDTLRRIDVVEREDGLRLTSPARTLFGLAWLLGADAFEQAWEDARLKGYVTTASARDYWRGLHERGRNGSAGLGDLLRTTPDQRPAESGLEVRLIQAMRRVGLPEPVRQHDVTTADGKRYRLDLAFVDCLIDVEADHSWWHGSARRQRADRQRDEALRAMGWLPMRFGEDAILADADGCAREVARARSSRLAALAARDA